MSTTDWKVRAERESAVILAECGMFDSDYTLGYERLISLLAIAWMQGSIYGTHETLADAEQAFERLKAAL